MGKKTKKNITVVFNKLKNPRVAVVVVALIGVITLVGIQAASPNASVEPEKGSGVNFSVLKDPTASRGEALLFGQCTDEGASCISENSSGSFFREVFNGSPPTPLAAVNNYDRWYTQPTMQGPTGWTLNPEPMIAQHGTDCGKPGSRPKSPWNGTDEPAGFHIIRTLDETVYRCKDHIMTASNPPSTGTAAGMVVMKPNHMVDLSKGEAVVSIDVSTKSPSSGDWWDIWITPWDDQLIAPSEHRWHFTGAPKNAIQLTVRDHDQNKNWAHQIWKNFVRQGPDRWQESSDALEFWKFPNIRPIVSESDTRRDVYEVRMTKDLVKLYIKSPDDGQLKLVDEFDIPGGFPANEAVVQFLSTNYEPEMNGKFGCAEVHCPSITIPATWHWDNAIIKPAIEYKLIRVTPRLVYGGMPSNKLTFDQPAPKNARMLFTGNDWDNQPKISFNNGNTWIIATQVRPPNDHPGENYDGKYETSTYSIPVPEGATSALVNGRRGWDAGPPTNNIKSDWAAQNFHIIAR